LPPPIIPFYEEIQTDKGKVAVITIEQGGTKPYAVNLNGRHDIYIRTGSTNQLATREQIIRLAQESGLVHSETFPVSGSGFSDIDLALFIDYYKKYYEEELNPDNSEIIRDKLVQLDLMASKEHSGYICTIAGLLLFGKNPGRFLHQSGFRIIQYPGIDPELNSLSDEVLNGALAEVKNLDGDIIIPGLMNKVLNKLQEKISSELLAGDYLTRERVWDYPPEVLREVIVNAAIHRGYTKANRNKIEIFSDRMEITSFGSLPNTLTIEKIKTGQQYPRNPILVRIAKDYRFIDDRGLGIRRKVLPILRQLEYPEPLFENTEDYFKVTILKKRSHHLSSPQ